MLKRPLHVAEDHVGDSSWLPAGSQLGAMRAGYATEAGSAILPRQSCSTRGTGRMNRWRPKSAPRSTRGAESLGQAPINYSDEDAEE